MPHIEKIYYDNMEVIANWVLYDNMDCAEGIAIEYHL